MESKADAVSADEVISTANLAKLAAESALDILIDHTNIDSSETLMDQMLTMKREGQIPEGFGITLDFHKSNAVEILLIWPMLERILAARNVEISREVAYLRVIGPANVDEEGGAEVLVGVLKERGILCPIMTELK